MNAGAIQSPRCRTCAMILQPPGDVCGACQTVQNVAPQLIMRAFVPLKSKGVAVLLTFLWLGAGHMYADRIATGIILAIIDAVLVLTATSVMDSSSRSLYGSPCSSSLLCGPHQRLTSSVRQLPLNTYAEEIPAITTTPKCS